MPRLKICQISGKSQSRHYLHAHKSVGTDFSIVIPDLEITELEPRTDKSSLEGFPLCLGDTLLTSLLEEPRSISTSVFAPAVHFTQSGHLVQMFMEQMFFPHITGLAQTTAQ